MSKRARSPVLGYNHNLRYRGRTFHVQTEDSGQGYARLYTHLFFEGTILSSKKQEYDPEAPEDSVRALMQQLHKAMIRELTHAEHDARISAFFTARGEPAMLEERPAAVTATAPPVAAVAPAPVAVTPAPVIAAAPAPPSVEVVAAGVAPVPSPAVAPVAAPPTPRPQVTAKPVVIVQPHPLTRSPVQVSSPADGVVVRRNVVINVGTGQPQVRGTNGTPGPTPAPTPGPLTARTNAGGGHYAVREGGALVAGNRTRPAASPQTQSQPLASSREIRMPWETPGPQRIAHPTSPPVATQTAVPEPAPVVTGKIRMPWDPPASTTHTEPFRGDLVSDKSLDEVILEYLADDGEAEER